ncbi:TRAP transporter substrate-binding protein DctP [Desulfosediminicola sp.]|uniref:TRAP transporter substrate-binding protein n=1 Tax=Desulfosediminicola sp. TaxID=2886825 RepID=UPI003AF26246
MRLLTVVCFTILIGFGLTVDHAQAKAKHLFKIASLAPDGSIWVTKFEDFTKEVSEKTGGEVGFRVYPGGVMGDDMAMYRKMRVGQLQGGGFTMTGMASVVPDFTVMSVPFLFNSYAETDAVRTSLMPDFREEFEKKGLELIAMTEVGFIYTMSTKPITTVSELQQSTSWIPSGDPLASAFLNSLDITPVQLTIPDVLSSLQTGLIDTVYNSLYGSIVLQWFTKARYVTDAPFAYAYGCFLLDKKKFDKLPKEYQDIIQESADRHFSDLIDATRKSNSDSRSVMSSRGVKFVEVEPETLQSLKNQHNLIIDQLKDNSFSDRIYQKTLKVLSDYRANQ